MREASQNSPLPLFSQLALPLVNLTSFPLWPRICLTVTITTQDIRQCRCLVLEEANNFQ